MLCIFLCIIFHKVNMQYFFRILSTQVYITSIFVYVFFSYCTSLTDDDVEDRPEPHTELCFLPVQNANLSGCLPFAFGQNKQRLSFSPPTSVGVTKADDCDSPQAGGLRMATSTILSSPPYQFVFLLDPIAWKYRRSMSCNGGEVRKWAIDD